MTTTPPHTFAKLFCDGARWTLDGTSVVTGPDDSHQAMIEISRKTGPLTCIVSSVKEIQGGWTSALACTNSLHVATRFPTHLAATPSGLWASDHDLDPSTLAAADRVLAEPPVRAMKDQLFAEAGATQWVSNHGDLWCFGENSAGMGQVSAWTLCIRDGELAGASREETSSQDFSQLVTSSWGAVFPMEFGGS